MYNILNMVEEFTLDFMVGMAFGITTFFAVYSCTAMFQAFRLPADAS